MRQLFNQYDLDIEPGQIGTTVRLGSKWADIRQGEIIELCTGTAQEQKIVGTGEAMWAYTCHFYEITARSIEQNHEASSRLYSGLLASMRRAYGSGFSESDVVTVLCYRRLT